jgi:IclR family transcriptional regulator, pca regulon regulatory protein
MASRGTGPDFIEALARGLDVLRCFGPAHHPMSLSEVAEATNLARATARRILLTLQELGYVRGVNGGFELTPRVLDLGMTYISGLGLWDLARPHMEALVARTGESSSLAQLEGSDIVHVAGVSVSNVVELRTEIGTRFPALLTSQGRVLLAGLPPAAAEAALATASRSMLRAPTPPKAKALHEMLEKVRVQGYAVSDGELAPSVRSIAVPVSDGRGEVRAAMNLTFVAAETSLGQLTDEHLPELLQTAAAVSADWGHWQTRSQATVEAARD